MARQYYIYILASQKNGTLYIGVTNSMVSRVWNHKSKLNKGFTKKYDVTNLVYYEIFDDIGYAIQREKQLKKWNRKWKLRLIEKFNPSWQDLYNDICF